VELLRVQLDRDPPVVGLHPGHVHQVHHRRRGQLTGDHRPEQLQAAAPAELRGVGGRIGPGEGTAARRILRLRHGLSLAARC
jgi:hypothetical protein